ncbi:hypothetical protein MKK75_25425 [Methylobacterium sp. J-030]|uniref:hypothetical protein n=1 Tax=Methylobacterium sp. J-030 TaxID=2836627 RepID=UPI001FBAA967|nr:hypothetical protein [Methylobacterium sp. J-030]MCJ2072100.1 hypothetical protein [Methylobacterium sp. J-030]
MPEPDLRAAFAKLCADMPAGDTGEASYEETLRIAVRRLGRRSHGLGAAVATPALSSVGTLEPDCPFMISVAALSREPAHASPR